MTMHVLETERLRLRRPELDDAPAIQHLASDERIARTTSNIPHPYPDGLAAHFITTITHPAWESGKDYTFAVTRRESGALIGMIGLHRENSNRAQMGYWVGVPYWNNGYATEAARRVIAFGFEDMGLHRVYAHYFVFNPASRRVMEKAGMTYEGLLRGHLEKNGVYIDTGVCGIVREDWEAAR